MIYDVVIAGAGPVGLFLACDVEINILWPRFQESVASPA
jgi:hypothetical protein